MRRRLEKVVLAGDGTRLYARMTYTPGADGVPIICANGIGVATFFWRYVEEDFSRTRPVIVWDYRGHGQSEWPRDIHDLTMESNADDMQRVLAAFGHQRAIALGHSMGCQVVYTFAHRHPQAAAMLVPMLGTVGHPVKTFMLPTERTNYLAFKIGHTVGTLLPDALGRSQRRLIKSALGRRLVSRIARSSGLCHPTLMHQEDLENYLDHFAAFSPLVFFRMAEHMNAHTAEPFLAKIQAPTLVVAGERDIFTPLRMSKRAVEQLPTARLLVLEKGSHAGLVEQPDVIHQAMEDFLREHRIDEAAPVERPAQVA